MMIHFINLELSILSNISLDEVGFIFNYIIYYLLFYWKNINRLSYFKSQVIVGLLGQVALIHNAVQEPQHFIIHSILSFFMILSFDEEYFILNQMTKSHLDLSLIKSLLFFYCNHLLLALVTQNLKTLRLQGILQDPLYLFLLNLYLKIIDLSSQKGCLKEFKPHLASSINQLSNTFLLN